MRRTGISSTITITIACFLAGCAVVATPTPLLRRDQFSTVQSLTIRNGGFGHGRPWDTFWVDYFLEKRDNGFVGRASYVGIYTDAHRATAATTVTHVDEVLVPTQAAEEFFTVLGAFKLTPGSLQRAPYQPTIAIAIDYPDGSITYFGGFNDTTQVVGRGYSYIVSEGDLNAALGKLEPHLKSDTAWQKMKAQLPTPPPR